MFWNLFQPRTMFFWILVTCLVGVYCQEFCNKKGDTVSCKYKCRCNGTCSKDGNCESSFCSKGWFGIACQYSDVASNATIQPKGAETLLANSSRQDCEQRSGPQYVLLTWSEPLPFTWLRIKIVNQTCFTNISLKLNDVLCQKTKIYSVDNTTLDIACDTNISMTALKLEGDIIEKICTLFVSGGRNLAIFKNSSESSTFGSPYYGPQFAVDGIITSSCLNGGCSQTNKRDRSPKWTVYFDQQYNINKCVLYNRIDKEIQRLDNFILEMLDNKNRTKFDYKNTETRKLIYTVLVQNDGYFAARVRQNDTFLPQPVTYVSLNEFEAYGECPRGFWGLSCTEKCQAPCNSSCHAEHGKCNTKCIGYKDPPECSIECDSTEWGPNCLNECSANCSNSLCDKFTGLCLFGCLGYQDFPYCTKECDKTFYGLNCTEKCPTNCFQRDCNSESGMCLQCIPGYEGDFCQNNFCNIPTYAPPCKYACRCKGQCDSEGNCLGSSCLDGWFGLACQYSDVAVIAEIQPPTAKTLRSNSTEDCNQRLDPADVLLTWSEAIPFTWLRIKVKNKTSFKDISLSLNNALCQNTRIFSVDNATLDLYCDNNVSMTTLKLEGNSVGNICTLFVSGGRNVALFQKTYQSSTYASNAFDSKYAVDGKILSSCYYGYCSHTNANDKTPYWIVKFGQEYNIKKCILYNRVDYKEFRLKGFLLEMLDNKNVSQYSYRNVSEPTKPVYTVLNLKGDAIAGVKISQVTISPEDYVPFVCLNEFEAYGDCLPGFWGLDCKKLCPEPCKSSCHAQLGTCNTICNGYSDPPLCSIECVSTKWGPNCLNNCNASCYNSSCDKFTGICSTGCIGYQDFPYCTATCSKSLYGLNCTKKCPLNCEDNSCNTITGECFGCKPGYTGISCDNTCSVTYFGSNCRETCSAQCSQNVCDPQTGRCLNCIPGYKGEFCNIICDSKYYGQNCSNICSTSCVDQTCDRYDGHCLRCNKTMYGRQCLEKCSSRCLNDSCDVSTGKCLACKPDYVGDFCDTNPMDVSVAVGVAVGAATVVVLLMIAGIVAYKKRVQQTKPKSDAGIDNVVKSQENDHYESIQNKDRNDSISIHDHYDIVSSESDWKQKENESQYETVSSQNPYDKLSSDVNETSNAQYEKVSSPNQYENVSRQKQLEHFSIDDK